MTIEYYDCRESVTIEYYDCRESVTIEYYDCRESVAIYAGVQEQVGRNRTHVWKSALLLLTWTLAVYAYIQVRPLPARSYCSTVVSLVRSGSSFSGVLRLHTPSTAFRHLPLNSARTELSFISAQLPADAVSGLRKVWALTNKTVEAT